MNVSLHYKELKAELSMGSQACNRLLSKGVGWGVVSTKVQGQPCVHSETLSPKQTKMRAGVKINNETG